MGHRRTRPEASAAFAAWSGLFPGSTCRPKRHTTTIESCAPRGSKCSTRSAGTASAAVLSNAEAAATRSASLATITLAGVRELGPTRPRAPGAHTISRRAPILHSIPRTTAALSQASRHDDVLSHWSRVRLASPRTGEVRAGLAHDRLAARIQVRSGSGSQRLCSTSRWIRQAGLVDWRNRGRFRNRALPVRGSDDCRSYSRNAPRSAGVVRPARARRRARGVALHTIAGHIVTKFPGDYRSRERVDRDAVQSSEELE